MKARKPRNPVARQLRSPAWRKRVVRSRKTYRRKGRQTCEDRDSGDNPRCARPPGLRAARGCAAPASGPPGWRMMT